MCGIAGSLTWNAPPDTDAVRRMTARLTHRGPDAEGFSCRGPLAVGHRRLSVIDVSEAANQPMADHTGRFSIVYNGEIYNFHQIRDELARDGATFRTRSDTEVILEAYKRWDVACLERLNGMFAFALWDDPRRRMLLARDRAGEKPLYYREHPGGGLIFSSELKALRAHAACGDRINARALGHYLSLNYTFAAEPILVGIRKLEPAHYLLVERDRPLRPVRYWDLAAHFRNKQPHRSIDEAADELDALITDAVRLRLVSDVPLGAFLSGGLDSSTIVAAMCRLRAPAQNKTFSIGFGEDTYNELPAARAVSRALGVEHHDQVVRVDMAAALPAIVRAADEPFADTSAIPMFYLAMLAREHVTVSLSGDGADEAFAGYDTYTADRLLHATRWAPGWATRALGGAFDAVWPVSFAKVSFDFKARQFLRSHRRGADRAHAAWRTIFTDDDIRTLVRPEHTAIRDADAFEHVRPHLDEVRDCHYLDRAQYVDIKTWLTDDILVKVDRVTMAHSLEARAPFLDHRILEFAASLPPDWRLRGLRRKHILKVAQKRHVPAGVIDRPKRGFNAPVSHWLAGPLAELGRAATGRDVLGDWFDTREVERLWDDHRTARRDNGLKLFGLTCLGLWITDAA